MKLLTNSTKSRKGYFIAGTDTGVGKTQIAVMLLQELVDLQSTSQSPKPVAGLKPVASGCAMTPNGLRNDDALHLQAQASLPLTYEQINPYSFAPPIAPHIAAQQAGVTLSVSDLLVKYHALKEMQPDTLWVIEGAGGWLVPLNTQETMADFARALGLPIIFVVGMRLGCLNHTLLTWQAMRAAHVPIAGWVANRPEPVEQLAYEENIATLVQRLDAPLLANLSYNPTIKL